MSHVRARVCACVVGVGGVDDEELRTVCGSGGAAALWLHHQLADQQLRLRPLRVQQRLLEHPQRRRDILPSKPWRRHRICADFVMT